MAESLNLHQYPFTPKRVTVEGGYRISCVDEGQGRAIVFVHGNPTWSYLYRNLITSLNGSHRCIAPDHLGCGLSDKPQEYPYRLINHIDNLEQVLDQLEVESCILVMHDWGGAIGMGWAGRHPDRVDGLVVMNTAAFRSKLIPWRIAVCGWPLVGPLLVRGMNAFAGAAIHMAVARKMDSEVAAGFLYPYDSWANRVAVLRFVQDIPLRENHPSWPELVRVEKGLERLQGKPMLLCWGGRDFCFHDAFYTEWQRRFPWAECHYYPDAGHYLMEDAFDAVRENIERFLPICGDGR
jgi:haloalkane dehalogenase